jgi:hypothetical protein
MLRAACRQSAHLLLWLPWAAIRSDVLLACVCRFDAACRFADNRPTCCCGCPAQNPDIANMIKISPWGMHTRNDSVGAKNMHKVDALASSALLLQPGCSVCAFVAISAPGACAAYQLLAPALQPFHPLAQNNMEFGCYDPLRDIVAPANMGEAALIAKETFGNKSAAPYHNISRITTTLFFAGGLAEHRRRSAVHTCLE